jgi:hypothetical protein
MALTLLVLSLLALSHSQPQPNMPPYWGWPFIITTTSDLGREYRNLSGWGNNQANPTWGTKYVPFLRHIMPTKYYTGPADPSNASSPLVAPEDGVDPTLPNPREVSHRITEVVGKHVMNHVFINQIHLDWGHLIVTDLINSVVLPPFIKAGYGVTFERPANDYWWNDDWGDEIEIDATGNVASAPTCVPDGVPFTNCIKTGKQSYIYNNRFMPYPGTGAGTGNPKLQFGDTTQYLDLSMIYGDPNDPQVFVIFESNPYFEVDNVTHKLQNFGKFSIGAPAGYSVPLFDGSDIPTMWGAAGDFRFNKTPGLRVLMLMFMLNHNSIIDDFLANSTSSGWSNETLFHEARRKNIAIYQSICFREYLAAATGKPAPPYSGYKPDVNPGVDSFFAIVSMRYGHSGIAQQVPYLDNNLNSCPFGGISAQEIFYPGLWTVPDPVNPFFDPETNQSTTTMRRVFPYECIIRGLSHSSANLIDLGYIDELRNFLTQSGGPRRGEDLIATDIYRSRDMGVPSYNDAREIMNLTRIQSFAELTDNVALQNVLEDMYGSVDRLDAYVGAMAEFQDFIEMGELNAAVLQEQFGRLRDGDRFFFENPDQFTPDEISDIHQIKLRDLFLKHFPNISESAIPTNAFYLNQRQLESYVPTNIFPDPSPHPKGLPWTTKELIGVYVMSWALDRDVDPPEVTFQLQVQTDGWAGLGWKPDALGSMKGADIALCRITDDGVAECRDSKAHDVGVPLLDSDIGGKQSFRNVTLSRVNGIFTAIFTRDIGIPEGEALYDNDITDGTRIIFAFNPYTNDLIYHGPTRYPGDTIDFISDYKGPALRVSISMGILIFLYVISAIGALLSIFYIGLVLAKKDYFRFQTPEFCILVSVGSLFGYASVLLLLPDSQTNGTCKAHLWLFGMSFWMVFLGFFIKVARVWYIVKQAEKRLESVVLEKWQLLVPLAICMAGETLFNILWDTLVPPDLDQQLDTTNNTYILYCAGIWYMWLISVVTKALFLGTGVILCYVTQRLPIELNWSREIASVIYTMAIVLFIGIPLGFALQTNATMVILLKGILICVAYITVTLIIHFDSLKRIIAGKDAREQTRTGNTIKTTKGGSSTSKV